MGKKILIVGGGLAGSCLAIHLLERKHNITLLDSGENHSSRVAAGLINPLVFRRMTKSWRVDEFIPFAETFYQSLESTTSSRFFHPIVIRRFFSSQQEREFWNKKVQDPLFHSYMNEVTEEDESSNQPLNNFGSGRVKKASWVDTVRFLSVSHAYFKKTLDYRVESFDASKFHPETDHLQYKGEVFDAVVFCQGYLGITNPWFNYLPLNQTKGEVLTIQSSTLPTDESWNRKCFVLPIANSTFKVGSTYVWNTSSLNITEEGKNLILENLSVLTLEKVEVIEQVAGVRPTTTDRRPLMGQHPNWSNLFIFNGLGTKGYMMAPLLAKEMTEHILHGTPLNREVSIERFH